MRLPLTRLSAVACTAFLLVAAAQTPDTDPTDGATPGQLDLLEAYLPEIEPSDELDGPTLVTGHVDDAEAGVPVIATAWPDPAELADLEVGDKVGVVTIAKTLTDADGNYELVADPDAVKDVVGATEETVNFDVVVPTSEDIANATAATTATLSVKKVSTPSNKVLTDVDVDIAAERPATIDEAATDTATSVRPTASCGSSLVARYDDRPMTAGTSFSTTSKVTTTFQYKKGSESSLGVGFSAKGSAGSFKANGTHKVKSSSATTYDAKKGAHGTFYKKYQDYGKFFNCVVDINGYAVIWYSVSPIGVPHGSYTAKSTSIPTAKHCTRYSGASLTIDKSKAQLWSSGVAIGDKIGIDLSAQTGWSNETRLDIKRTSGTGFLLCGTTDKPEQKSPGRLVAKP